jgi:hypothetical protein
MDDVIKTRQCSWTAYSIESAEEQHGRHAFQIAHIFWFAEVKLLWGLQAVSQKRRLSLSRFLRKSYQNQRFTRKSLVQREDSPAPYEHHHKEHPRTSEQT